MATTFQPLLANGTAITITLASLATTTADPPVGREATAIDNSSNLYEDALLFGQITTGTSPTASKQIVVCVAGIGYDGTTLYYPGGITGSDAGLTPTFAGVIGPPGLIVPIAVIPTNSTSNVGYKFGPLSVANALGLRTLPRKWTVFLYHNTGVNLHATSGNHYIYYQGLNGYAV